MVAVTVAGSDPSGGAGIQADLKTFAALGGYGCAVLTGLTAQSTVGVTRVMPVPADMVTAQLETLLADVAVDAVKIGMLSDAAVAAAVADVLEALRAANRRDRRPGPAVVLDPVMVATSGDRLLEPAAEDVVRERLLPLADLVTPNLPEAAALLGADAAHDASEAADQARALLRLGAGTSTSTVSGGPRWALVKGGHLVTGGRPGAEGHPGRAQDGEAAVDHLAGPGDGEPAVVTLSSPRVSTRNTHGTGCTLSSACAVLRPLHDGWPATVRAAKDYLTQALVAGDRLVVGGTGLDSGRAPWTGHGPVDHGFAQRPAARPEPAP
ncbi:bifunctional hydroxymethylpyrimidine kinase/phosphomethylpyrimidine kinase [Xylanimonas oleitrophica]|uniref:Bifunctional hydroxymethylpyrimidine kinase/phosphomethylpyrimidine kinase n=1 Tax=Xylanimonas oleitrophica TaxID=2607479 RepID=A0A2W5XXC8_9MICO|nr:bifunctional hydroxymethylpyrimidine kinase/phosphomethylpyrimidine kinase [Xylanimonas oleitrophica]PZR55378.1 bifunctional hydroxymethylpyrimidine kinase/phosphomethylpyrimidine kinase [Xylanimonas oleitrophica]